MRQLPRVLLLVTCVGCVTSPRPYHFARPLRHSSRSPKLEEVGPPEDPNLPQKRLTQAVNKFGQRLYNVMHDYHPDADYSESPEDLVYSPITVFTSLSTLQAATDSDTKGELSTLLSLSKVNDSVLTDGLGSILSTFETRDPDESRVQILNRVFLDHAFVPMEKYVNLVRDKFHGEVVQTHFGNATAATAFVNEHVLTASHGVLDDVISVDPGEGVTDPSVQVIDGGLMLVSGVTFAGDFDRPFTPLLTRREGFLREDGAVVAMETMHRDGIYYYAEVPELNATALTMLYKDKRYSLTILLPEEGVSLSQLEENLELFPAISVLSRLKKQYVQVSLPRFQVSSTVDLVEPLEKLGVRRVFGEGSAQLGRIAQGDGLYLTNAVHKVVFEVGEGGSRAGVQNFIEAVPAQARALLPFKATRPFAFFVADSTLGTVLLQGRKAA